MDNITASKTRQSKPFWNRLKQTSIVNKIYGGYGISLGIAVLGVLVGLGLGNHYHQTAKEQLRTARIQGSLLAKLQLIAIEFRPEKEFLPILQDERQFRKAEADFEARIKQVQTLLYKLKETTPSDTMTSMQPFLQVYEQVVDDYAQRQRMILSLLAPDKWEQADLSRTERQINRFLNSPPAVKFSRYSNELKILIEASEKQIEQAEQALVKADRFRTLVILGSLLLSVVIATILAYYTARTIARPIQKVTEVAQRVTKTEDFDLRVPINSSDEVSLLAVSINQLIEWVEQYTRELKEAQTHLIQTEKMSSLGQMVAGIAHEINNPIGFIQGNLSPIESYVEELLTIIDIFRQHCSYLPPELINSLEESDIDFISKDFPKLLQSMRIGTDRICEIVLSLRNFSRLDEAQVKACDLHEGLESTLLLLNHRLTSQVEVVRKYGNIPDVACHPAQINQVFMNILSNAIDALLEREDQVHKKILIVTESQYEQVLIRISDNGGGIPPEILGKLFDPFFTTKPVGKGTGLGLAISYKIIEKHQGKIQVHSSGGEGTEFVITLPIQSSIDSEIQG
ncbi:sensor histidine kinase [Limnoraphis robusta]|uniref:histidine kinase n=1 Tax=Limnoraphis robusta CCNP1315 TaxID=3110306 RepID=A0ABU5U0N1_9CYAN|nr:ATP-binding protein [Limnoraphis robusta]MEA5520560.1 ATP-binding protein [Limnoraphis robusta CCNP1315]MEA5547242.1 ATP-binding protein [Limnoraphis robusta CCNP1324]